MIKFLAELVVWSFKSKINKHRIEKDNNQFKRSGDFDKQYILFILLSGRNDMYVYKNKKLHNYSFAYFEMINLK